MTAPKLGDRVRLTPKDGGETVIVGNVTVPERLGLETTYITVAIPSDHGHRNYDTAKWNIEVIEPTTLDKVKALKPGAVIHNGRKMTALAVKMHNTGDWYFIYSDGDAPCPISEESLAQFIDANGPWEIKYEGHEVF